MAAHSLRSLDYRRQYPAYLAGYHSRSPSGKSKTKLFIVHFESSFAKRWPLESGQRQLMAVELVTIHFQFSCFVQDFIYG
jgi:hypothetical protein